MHCWLDLEGVGGKIGDGCGAGCMQMTSELCLMTLVHLCRCFWAANELQGSKTIASPLIWSHYSCKNTLQLGLSSTICSADNSTSTNANAVASRFEAEDGTGNQMVRMAIGGSS